MEDKILVIGSTGMLGHQVLKRLEKNSSFEVFDFVHKTKRGKDSILCDANNFDVLEEQIKVIKPTIIINCVGVLIKQSKKSIIDAIRINALLPHTLERICNNIGAKLIHISTDCVFSGEKGNYTESALKDANDVYGGTKALGEVINNRHLTIRTSIVGPELKENGEGLLHWFLSTNDHKVNGYSKVLWGGVTTFELAKAIEFAITNKITGLWNLTNGQSISKFEMLQKFNEYLKPVYSKIIVKSDLKTSNKSLKSERSDISYNVPNYENMFNQMFLDISNSNKDYPGYFRISGVDK